MVVRRIFSVVVLALLTIFLVALIIANRQMVTLTLDPFQINPENFTYRAPFFIWIFVFFSLGVLLSSMMSWFAQRRYRRALKESKAELEKLKMSINNKSDITAL
ncbi:LapA family protein [Bartonella australis]|nr:LapA family protein [Bartonella australis]